MRFFYSVTIAILIAASPAIAHTGVAPRFGVVDGLLHPLLGVDHLLTMVGVGLWAALVGGTARFAWPVAFLSLMAAGGAIALAGITFPGIEALIVASVIVIGATIALQVKLPVAAGAAICAVFALAHGHAHGTELPPGASAAGYVAGFILATAALHAMGITLGIALQRRPLAVRFLGGAIAATGTALAFA
jgi:urease accessory protein